MRLGRPPLGDVALAVVLALLAAAEVAGTSPSARAIVFAVAFPLPLAWRRVVPVGATVAILAIAAADELTGGDSLADYLYSTVVVLVALYSAGAYAELEHGLAVLAGYLTVAWVSVYTEGDSGASDYAFAATVAVAPWAVGRIAGTRLAAAVAARERARRAVAEERARIARELHDVVAHAVGVIVVQAGAAEQVLDKDPAAAREALADIRRTGKDALVDLRRMLGLLRADEDTAAAVEPQPGLDDLGSLAERLRHAGLPVELSIEGERRPVPAGVALTAYRVAQEALTNVLKHTTDARAQVTLVYGSEALELCVTNDGRATTNGAGTGHGLIGMRERVSLYGGELDAAPLAGGGFRVLARLPYA
jgi:signal transduction histidine kinase